MHNIRGRIIFVLIMFVSGAIVTYLEEEHDIYFFRSWTKPSDLTWAGFIFVQIIAVAFLFFRKVRIIGVGLCVVSLPSLWYLIDKPLIQDRMTRLRIELMLESLGWPWF